MYIFCIKHPNRFPVWEAKKFKRVSSDIAVEVAAKVKQLHSQVEQLSEKSLELEGWSKRQNLRIAGVKEGEGKGQKTRDFVAQLLTDAFKLDERPVTEQAHRALRERSDISS